jgi:hypothetical protein
MSREATYQVTLDMSMEKAWDIMQDLTVPDKYVPGVYKCMMHTEKTKGVGTSRRVWKKMYGFFPVELDETVVEWNEGTGFKLHLHNGDKDRAPLPKSYFIYNLRPANPTGDKTLFTGTMGYTFWGGSLGALIDVPFVYPGVKMEIRSVVLAIKYYYETGNTPTSADIKQLKANN